MTTPDSTLLETEQAAPDEDAAMPMRAPSFMEQSPPLGMPGASGTIGKIATALAAAQAEFDHAVKTETAKVKSDKSEYTYGYATMAGILEATRPALTKHGVAVIQRTRASEKSATVTTILTHSSGEWMTCGSLEVPTGRGGGAQGLGSALSYARRYAYAAAVGVAVAEDDDAQSTQPAKPRTKATKRPTEPKAKRDELHATISNLDAEQREVVVNRLRDGGIVWDDMTKAQAQDIRAWIKAATTTPAANPAGAMPCPACTGTGTGEGTHGECIVCAGSGIE